MEELTVCMMILSIALFVSRYFVKRAGADFVCVIMAICTSVLMLKDTTISPDILLPVLMPMILIIMLVFLNLMMGTDRRKF